MKTKQRNVAADRRLLSAMIVAHGIRGLVEMVAVEYGIIGASLKELNLAPPLAISIEIDAQRILTLSRCIAPHEKI
jgi:hypothetical protein